VSPGGHWVWRRQPGTDSGPLGWTDGFDLVTSFENEVQLIEGRSKDWGFRLAQLGWIWAT